MDEITKLKYWMKRTYKDHNQPVPIKVQALIKRIDDDFDEVSQLVLGDFLNLFKS